MGKREKHFQYIKNDGECYFKEVGEGGPLCIGNI